MDEDEEDDETRLTMNLTWDRSSPQACHSFRILDAPERGRSTPRHCSTRTSCLEIVEGSSLFFLSSLLFVSPPLLARCDLTRESRTSWHVVCLEMPDTHLGRSWKKKGISAMTMEMIFRLVKLYFVLFRNHLASLRSGRGLR